MQLASRLLFALVAAILALPVQGTRAADTYRVLSPPGGSSASAVLLVPGCSGFAGVSSSLYQERATELQAAGYWVVFVDYLQRRNLTNCAGGRDVSHAEVGKDILDAAAWAATLPSVASGNVFVIAWSYGGGGVLAALASIESGRAPIARAAMYYPDCRRSKPWSSTAVSVLMLLGASDEVALPFLCDAVIKGAPPNTLRTVVYPGARHAFDVPTLPERAEFGRIGFNAEAAQAAWRAVLEFLR